MLTPMRSFTLATGFWLSSFATTSATQPAVTLFSRTSGVWPISSVTSFAILIIHLIYLQRLRADFPDALFRPLIECSNTTNMPPHRDRECVTLRSRARYAEGFEQREFFDKEGIQPAFILRVKDDAGSVSERKYKLNTPIMRSVLAPRGTAFPPLEAAERLGCGTEIFGTTLRAFIPNIILFHVDLSRFRYGRWAAQHYTVDNTLFITSSVWII